MRVFPLFPLFPQKIKASGGLTLPAFLSGGGKR